MHSRVVHTGVMGYVGQAKRLDMGKGPGEVVVKREFGLARGLDGIVGPAVLHGLERHEHDLQSLPVV